MSTDQPKTPVKARPKLGSRSHTDVPTYYSPPKKTGSGNSGIESPRKQKQHHLLPFFGTSSQEHFSRPHVPHVRRRGDDAHGSRTNFRQHLPDVHPVDGLVEIVSSASGGTKNNGSSQNQQPQAEQGSQGMPRLPDLPAGPVRPEHVERERERGRLREKELRSSLGDLSELATGTTRRLDYAFYTVLEKAAQLHSTITSLQELSDSSRGLLSQFQHDIAEVDTEVHRQVSSFKDFSSQQSDVTDLISRLEGSKHKTEALSARLEVARKRVDLWEAREKEWQSKTSKRLTWTWALTVTFIGIIIAFVIWRKIAYTIPRTTAQAARITNDSLPGFIVDDLASFRSEHASVHLDAPASDGQALPTDRRLREFDEL